MAAVLGVLGVHRFYVGKLGTGILMFLTGGGAAIWWILDLVRISTGDFHDADGRRVLQWGVQAAPELLAAPELDDELEAINEDLDDVTVRLERLESGADPD